MLLLLAKIMAYYGERSGSSNFVVDLWIGMGGGRRIQPLEKFPAKTSRRFQLEKSFPPRRVVDFNLRNVRSE